MDIELLKTFLEVNRTCHFGKAADNLFLTQSAVSARVRQLEESLGVQLFERKRNDIKLTSSGLRFLPHAETIVALWQRARQETALEEDYSTLLAVGGLSDLWEHFLLEWLVRLRQESPDIVIHATALSSSMLSKQVMEGQLDLAFLFEPQFSPDLNARFLKRINLVMVSGQSGLSLEHAFDHDYIMIDWGTAYTVNHAREFSDVPSSPLYFSHGSMALSFMLKNAGTAYIPEDWVIPYLESGQLFTVNDAPVIDREIYATWKKNSHKNELIRKLLQYFT